MFAADVIAMISASVNVGFGGSGGGGGVVSAGGGVIAAVDIVDVDAGAGSTGGFAGDFASSFPPHAAAERRARTAKEWR